MRNLGRRAIALLLSATSVPALADVFVSVQDGAQVLVDGQQVVPSRPAAAHLAIIRVDAHGASIMGRVDLAASIIGPPGSVAVSGDGRFALVTASRRIDPADRTRIVPDDRVTVVALGVRPAVTQVVHAGAGASGVALSPSGRRVLVANRSAGTVSLFDFADGRLTLRHTVSVGSSSSSPAQPLFIDEDRALITRDGDSRVALLTLGGAAPVLSEPALAAGVRPYAMHSAGGRFAVVGNIGGGGRDVDTISLIALAGERPRVVDTVAVGLTPEGVQMSPDGRFVAVTVNNGSNMPRASRGYSEHGLLQIWRIDGEHLRLVTSAPMGGWGQGVAWTSAGDALVTQAALGNLLEVFRFDGTTLIRGPTIRTTAGPAGIAGPVSTHHQAASNNQQ